jgi:hypothetical protein
LRQAEKRQREYDQLLDKLRKETYNWKELEEERLATVEVLSTFGVQPNQSRVDDSVDSSAEEWLT